MSREQLICHVGSKRDAEANTRKARSCGQDVVCVGSAV